MNGENVNLGATDLSITVPSKMGTIAFGNAIDRSRQRSIRRSRAQVSAPPPSGSFQLTASDSSQLTATITNGVAALAVDTPVTVLFWLRGTSLTDYFLPVGPNVARSKNRPA